MQPAQSMTGVDFISEQMQVTAISIMTVSLPARSILVLAEERSSRAGRSAGIFSAMVGCSASRHISSLDWRDPSVREERYIADANYLSTLRGRVGWANGNVLFYITGGLAYLNAEVTTSSGGRDADQHGNTDHKDVSTTGGAAGAGIEWGLTNNLSVRTEGLYLFFDQRDSLANLLEGCKPGREACLNKDTNFFSISDGFVFRLGANWRFSGGYADASSGGALTPYLAMRSGPYNWS